MSIKSSTNPFMEQEIYEQYNALNISFDRLANIDKLELLTKLDNGFLEGITSIIISACGSSFHAGLVAKYFLENLLKISVKVELANEFKYNNFLSNQSNGILFISISQSGETLDTIDALKIAQSFGIKSLAITNIEDSILTKLSDQYLLTNVGIERSIASTKVFSAQVLLLYMLALKLSKQQNKINQEDLRKQLLELKESIGGLKIIPSIHERIKRLSKRYISGLNFLVLGRGIFYPLAMECALKLKETSYLCAQAYPTGEIKHGPLALLDERMCIIALTSSHYLRELNIKNIKELSNKNSILCVLSSEDIKEADDLILLSKTKSLMEEFFSMTTTIQLLSLEIALRININIDNPRYLTKSVTNE